MGHWTPTGIETMEYDDDDWIKLPLSILSAASGSLRGRLQHFNLDWLQHQPMQHQPRFIFNSKWQSTYAAKVATAYFLCRRSNCHYKAKFTHIIVTQFVTDFKIGHRVSLLTSIGKPPLTWNRYFSLHGFSAFWY